MNVVVHARDYAERLASVGALEEPTLLDADEQGAGILRVKIDVLGVRDVGRSREAPPRRVDGSQCRQLAPAATEVVAVEEMRGLGPGENAGAGAEPGAGEAVHVVLGQAFVSALPGAA